MIAIYASSHVGFAKRNILARRGGNWMTVFTNTLETLKEMTKGDPNFKNNFVRHLNLLNQSHKHIKYVNYNLRPVSVVLRRTLLGDVD